MAIVIVASHRMRTRRRGDAYPIRLSRLVGLLLFCFMSDGWGQTLIVGAKNFTEQSIVAEITRQLLEHRGIAVRTRTGLSSTGVRRELEGGLVDLYWEYTGTSLLNHHRVTARLGPEEAYATVKALDAARGLVWLRPSRVDNTYALAMRRADAQAKGLATISDLAALVRGGATVRFACNTEFFIRPDGLLPLQRAYAFEFGMGNVLRVEEGTVYERLRSGGAVDVGLVFSTDGRVAAFDLVLLRDDRRFFPSYRLAPVVRHETLARHPELVPALETLAARLDDPTIRHLNALVDVDGMTVADAAQRFLRNEALAP